LNCSVVIGEFDARRGSDRSPARLPPTRKCALAAALIDLSLVAVVWLSTALWQVPRHKTLGSGFDRRAWSELLLSNWVRTVAYGTRGVLVLWMTARAIG
jgi:hypothetical protein